jgi:hypothetical protein
MLRFRRLDGPGLGAYLDELRPRVLVVRIRAKRFRLLWAVPMAPFEELLAFALGLALLVPMAARFLPAAPRARLERRGGLAAAAAYIATKAGDAGNEAAQELPQGLLARLSLIASGGLGEALRLPPGTPYLSVQGDGVTIDVRPY